MIRILVVDDQTFTRKAINAVLEAEENFVLAGEAENGVKALELMNQATIDIAIVDLQMPEMDGFKLTEKICNAFPETKVIVLSGSEDKYSINKAVKAGARGYLLKDITHKEQIIETINQVQRGYFQLGPGLLENLISSLISYEEDTTKSLLKIETNSYKNYDELQAEILHQSQQIRHQILAELDAEILNMKIEFKQGLTEFQSQVAQQIKGGFEDFTYNYQQNKFIPEIWHKRYIQLSQSINFLESQYNLSINKLKTEIATLRYLVIFLLIVLVPIFLDHIFSF